MASQLDIIRMAREANGEERRIRHNIRRVTRRAIKAGKLLKLPCFCCGDLETEAHHPDYSAPLDVVWLCKKHHQEIHR